MNKPLAALMLLLAPSLANAAAFTSKATGNWSASGQTTWNEVGVPGDGDTVTIGAGHTITVDANTTVGDSPNPTPAAVITANTSGALTVAAGVTFTIKGCVQMEDGNFTLGAGSVVEFQVPSGLRYWFRTAKAHSDTCKIVINGTSGSRAAFRSSSGAGIAYIDAAGFIGASLIQAEYCDFTRIGDGTEDFAEPYCNTTGHDFYLRYCTLTSCGELDTAVAINTNASFELLNTKWVTTVSTKCAVLDVSAAPAMGKTRSIVGCAFDKTLDIFTIQGWTITNTYFADGFTGTASAGTTWTLFEDNFIRKTAQGPQTGFGDVTDCFFYKESVNNPHFVQPATSIGLTVSGCIFEHGGTHINGDCVLIPSPTVARTYAITGNIVLPNTAGDTSGTLFSALGNANATFSANHNTYFCNSTGTSASIAETYTGHTGMLTSFQSNLAWSDTANEAEILNDSGTDDAVNDYITDLGYNGVWNGAATLYAMDVANDVANDLTANDVSGDPQFVDETRDLASWDASLGGGGTASESLARLVADPYLIDDLVTWVKAGFVPTNVAFDGTAHDGGDIGAMSYSPAGVISPITTAIPGVLYDPLTGTIPGL